MGLARSKLFLSYSRGDAGWRDRFVKHLKTLLVLDKELWVDQESLGGGDQWRQEITQAARDSRCALLLITPNYLDKSRFAREELELLSDEQSRGLKLLPVLVEPCAWPEEAALAKLQFVRWVNAAVQEQTTGGPREVLRSIREAGSDHDIERAVIGACEQVRKELGVLAQTTSQQRDLLLDTAKELLAKSSVELEDAVHAGDFCVVYRGRWHGESVAVKVVPDAARRNRIRALFDSTLSKVSELRDPAFIRHHFHVVDSEPHCVVMDYVEWPTLDERLAQFPNRRLPARVVAQILATLSRAQSEAHACGIHLGPLSPANIHVGQDWELRISPIRVEGQLAKVAGLTSGQLINWDVLTTLTPEICDGAIPVTREELDRHEQYYLGLLGLELLLGRRPFEVRRFADFTIKERFFENPRNFFGRGTAEGRWAESEPAMTFLLATLLARDPANRFESAEEAGKEFSAIGSRSLPSSVRRRLESDVETVGSDAFSKQFYERLLHRRPELANRFPDLHAQEQRFSEALLDLVEFRPDATRSRFGDSARQHAGYQLTAEDYDAFEQSFIEEVTASAPGGPASGDAWKAALKMGLAVMSELERQPSPHQPAASPQVRG